MTQLPTSVLMILDERARQVTEEGYSQKHDLEHDAEQLAMAAGTYALPPDCRAIDEVEDGAPATWPWDDDSWKPTPDDRLRELVKAGALIVAEIDRLILVERVKETLRA